MACFKDNRWYVRDNIISVSYTGWVAMIELRDADWVVTFSEGSGGEKLAPVFCKTLEKAIDLIDTYSKKPLFQDLKKAIFNDFLPDECDYSSEYYLIT